MLGSRVIILKAAIKIFGRLARYKIIDKTWITVGRSRGYTPCFDPRNPPPFEEYDEVALVYPWQLDRNHQRVDKVIYWQHEPNFAMQPDNLAARIIYTLAQRIWGGNGYDFGLPRRDLMISDASRPPKDYGLKEFYKYRHEPIGKP